jgi:hypothetical protein
VLETRLRRNITRESQIMQSITDGKDLPRKENTSGNEADMEE